MKILNYITLLVLAILSVESSVAATIKPYPTMSNPTIDLTSATKVVEENILNFTRGLKHRDRTKLVEKITDELKALATVPARNEKGHFIADDPSTKKDESVAPAFPPAGAAISREPDPAPLESEEVKQDGEQENLEPEPEPEKEADPEEKQPELKPEPEPEPVKEKKKAKKK